MEKQCDKLHGRSSKRRDDCIMVDGDIRREVFSTEDMLSRSTFDIIFFIESKEMGRHATENTQTISAVTSFQCQKKGHFNIGDKSQHVPYQRCNKLYYPFN